MCVRSRIRHKSKGVLALTLLLAYAAAVQGQAIPDGAARVISLTGQVSVVRNSDLWAAKMNDIIPAGQEIISGPDGRAQLEVQDGSHFDVYPNSRIVFRANRGDWRQLLDVLLGKVRVHIEKVGGRPNPYRVNSPTALIAVRGTTFEVEVESDTATLVSVVEGLVHVNNIVRPGKGVLLKGGESVRVLAGEPLADAGTHRWQTVRQVMDSVLDRAIAMGRSGGPVGGGTSTPTTTPTGAGTPTGTPVGTTVGSGTITPPSGGRPGDTGNGDGGPGTVTPPTTGVPGTPGTGTPPTSKPPSCGKGKNTCN